MFRAERLIELVHQEQTRMDFGLTRLAMDPDGIATVCSPLNLCRRRGAPTHTNRLCSTAAAMKLANSGCGSNGRDFSSGWYCTPMNQGWSGILDRLRQQAVRRHAGEAQARGLQPLAIARVDLVAVAVALGDLASSP